MNNIKKILPIVQWLPTYKKSFLKGDLSAGLTVGVMLIPQGMAYAMIAGLPPEYGLYAALIPQVIYAIFGTSRQLAVGPVAMDSILVAAGLSTIAAVNSEQYILLAVALSFFLGVFQVAFGLFKLGFLVNFLSKPVISGFTSAAAIIIGLNQLKHILGINLGKTNHVLLILRDLLLQITTINWFSFGIAIGAILILKFAKRIYSSLPTALITVIFGILVTKFIGLENHGVAITGSIPSGFPDFSIPIISLNTLSELFPIAITLAFIAFMEAISISKAIQSKHKKEYDIDNNQEMIALGMGNILGSFFASYPTTGSFSRSAINDQAGAKTNLASIISAALVALTLAFLTPLFYHLPKAILGSIILVSVIGLIDFNYPKFLWKSHKQDFFMLFITFIVTLLFGIKEGISAGILISLILLIYRTTKPHIAVLGKLPESNDYKNVLRFPDLETRKDILILRQDGQLYFANITHFIDAVKKEVTNKGQDLNLIIFHCSSVSSIDSTALDGLKNLIAELNEQHIGVYFSGFVGPVRDFLTRTGFTSEVGDDHFFIDIDLAVDYLDNSAKQKSKQMLKRALQTNVFR